MDMSDRFWPRVSKTAGCWLWTGAILDTGYGSIGRPGGGSITTHRYSAMLHFGMFDKRLWVLHHCDVRACVRPDHLYLGTPADNFADMVARRERWGRKGQTHCKRGHPLDDSMYVSPSGKRECRACRAGHMTAYRERMRSAL